MTTSVTCETSKTVEGYIGTISKDNIYVSMEPLHDPECCLYTVTCEACRARCVTSFLFPDKLSFASVAKFAGVLSSQCRKLAELARKSHDGPKQAELFVEGDS